MTLRNPVIAIAIAAIVAAGCGGSSATPGVDVTGTWSGQMDSNTGPPGYDPVFGTYRMTLVLTQSGSAVTGTLTSDAAFSGTVAGGVSGDVVTLQIAVAACGPPGRPPDAVSLSGTVVAETPGKMNVTYVGTPCGVEDHGQGILNRQ